MSCKSALYAAMQTPTAVAVGGVVPLGSLSRRDRLLLLWLTLCGA